MTSFLFTHPACLLHDNGPGHPESPARLKAVMDELDRRDYDALQRCEAPRADREAIACIHDPAYIEAVLKLVPQVGYAALDHETSLSPGSGEAALRAAGSVVAAVDAVMAMPGSNAFCAVRPPGHHAAVPPASGFCLFNNIAIGAAHALAVHGLTRIAILDFDVHHGNGTQAWAEGQEGILFISSHQYPLWPGSGAAHDQGPGGNILNLPLPPDTNGDGFRAVMRDKALPAIAAFMPELIMISAGFDAHADDPLAQIGLVEEDYAWITSELVGLARRFCRGRIVSTLEGGYDTGALARSVGAHIKALMEV